MERPVYYIYTPIVCLLGIIVFLFPVDTILHSIKIHNTAIVSFKRESVSEKYNERLKANVTCSALLQDCDQIRPRQILDGALETTQAKYLEAV
jgi:galactokinase